MPYCGFCDKEVPTNPCTSGAEARKECHVGGEPALLSDRLRPNVEAAPWVIEEVKKMEAELRKLRGRSH